MGSVYHTVLFHGVMCIDSVGATLAYRFGFSLKDASEGFADDALSKFRGEVLEHQKKLRTGFKPVPKVFRDFQQPHPDAGF